MNTFRSQFSRVFTFCFPFFNQQNKEKKIPLSLEILTKPWNSLTLIYSSLSCIQEVTTRVWESFTQQGSAWPGEHAPPTKPVQSSPLSAKHTWWRLKSLGLEHKVWWDPPKQKDTALHCILLYRYNSSDL